MCSIYLDSRGEEEVDEEGNLSSGVTVLMSEEWAKASLL